MINLYQDTGVYGKTGASYSLLLSVLLFFSLGLAAPLTAHPAFNIRRGLDALQKGDLEAAETELQRARFAEPDNPVISYNLGVVSYRRRDYQKAASFFMASASTGKDVQMKFDSLYNLGNSAFKAGDYAAAVSAYSSSVEVKDDFQARYNLEVAQKKLQEQQDQQQQQDDQQKKDDQQQQDGQQGDKSQKDQQSDGQKNEDKDSGADQQKDSDENGQEQQQSDSDEQKQGEESDEQNSESQTGGDEDENASQTQQLSEQAAADPSEKREDIEMGGGEEQEQEPAKPEASERARALKNIKLNPYQVERLLQQMQERERKAQLHYRNEQRTDEADPFNMNAQQLQEWMQNRGRTRQQPSGEEPDW